MNTTNRVWQCKLMELLTEPDYRPAPRGKETVEHISGTYTVPMPAYLTLVERGVNLPFMLAEPAWILSGSNRVSDLEPFMKAYRNFSDDGVFLRGAYGPPIIDQLPYVVDSIVADPHTRQAVIDIWRNGGRFAYTHRGDPCGWNVAKDVPCTTGMQFLQRGEALHAVVTMRSQDIVQGFTYDVFTFSMVAYAVAILVKERCGRVLELGNLTVNAGSLHLYRDPFGKGVDQFKQAEDWIHANAVDESIVEAVDIVRGASTYEELIGRLYHAAETCRDPSITHASA